MVSDIKWQKTSEHVEAKDPWIKTCRNAMSATSSKWYKRTFLKLLGKHRNLDFYLKKGRLTNKSSTTWFEFMPFCLEKKGLFVFVIELGEMFFFSPWFHVCLLVHSKYATFLISLLSTTWICSKRHFVTNFLISLRTQRVISSKKASFCSFLFAQEGHLVAIFFTWPFWLKMACSSYQHIRMWPWNFINNA